MKAKTKCPTCASMISDGYTIDLTPWWRYYARKFNPFKRRRKMVPMEDVLPLIDALEDIEAHGRPHRGGDTGCGCDLCEDWDQASNVRVKFICKHMIP